MNTEERIKLFDELRHLYDSSSVISKDLREYLIDNRFFEKPASVRYHGAYSGGLFDHSYAVATTLIDFTKKLDLKWEHSRSPFVVGMYHDLCKLDNYIYNDAEDRWVYNNNLVLNGHGDKSVILLQKFMQLTVEEILCIRWHMGAFDEKDNWKHYNGAVSMFPNVLYTHTADMHAAHVMGT